MSDARDQTVVSSVPDSEPRSPGAWLKLERERQSLTTQRIAADMHLSIAAVDAIESNRFAVLGAPVFAKGHLRKYAALLGLPGDKVVALYDGLEDAPRQVDPIPLSQRAPEPALRPSIRDMLGTGIESRGRDGSGVQWIAIAALAVIAIAGAGWYYLGYRAKSAVESTVDAVEKEPVSSNPSPSSASPAATAEGSIPVQTASPAVAVAAAPVVATTPRPQRSAGTPPPGKVRVRLTFARESWVEVYDSGGNRMVYDVGRVDLPRLIDVEPPVLIVLGDASAVTTEANDKVVTVPQKNISGTVARFAIAADGSVR